MYEKCAYIYIYCHAYVVYIYIHKRAMCAVIRSCLQDLHHQLKDKYFLKHILSEDHKCIYTYIFMFTQYLYIYIHIYIYIFRWFCVIYI